jgi:tetratricopeptide (TPR) repeat protein
MRRALNEGRISPASLDVMRTSLAQLAASLHDSAVPSNAAPSIPAATAPSPLTPVPAADGAGTAVMQPLIQSASRIGQALGYRAVLALAVIPENAATPGARREATYVLYLVDALRETGQPLSFDESGADAIQMHEAAAVAASAFTGKELQLWTTVGAGERAQKIQSYLQQARAALDAKKPDEARAAAQQALALDPSLVEAHLLLGDATKKSDPAAAAAAYRLALGKNTSSNGEVWARIAAAHAAGRDWPKTLEAGRRALELRYDSAALRQAMAMAQFGRAQLFREAGRMENADSAEAEARDHIDRARAMSPDDPGTTRVLASYLVSQREYRAALQSLDALASRYPDDVEVQTLYATALTERGGRDADAFAAWARVWQMDDSELAPLTARYYRRIAEGFDEYVSELAKDAAQLTSGVSAGTVPREEGLLRIQRMNSDMQRAEAAIKMMQPPGHFNEAAHARRIFAADLLGQAIDQQRVFVETGDEIYRGRAADLHRQAITQLNSARTGGA